MRPHCHLLLVVAGLLAPGCHGPRDDPAPGTDGDRSPYMATAMNVPSESAPVRTEIATFGAGCFWCVEAVLEQVDGVLDVKSGYMGGAVHNPSYQEVCSGATGHAEVVQVTFDPATISYDALLAWFWQLHDPTTLNRQGADVGTQYRSAIFVHSDAQQQAAEAAKAEAQAGFSSPIVTEIVPVSTFFEAETGHQDYYRANRQERYCRMIIAPKLEKFGLDR